MLFTVYCCLRSTSQGLRDFYHRVLVFSSSPGKVLHYVAVVVCYAFGGAAVCYVSHHAECCLAHALKFKSACKHALQPSMLESDEQGLERRTRMS